MEIFLNGQSRNVDDGLTLAGLVEQLKMTPRHVAIEVNLAVVPRASHAEYHLVEGDRLEVVTLVGGG